MRHCAAFVTGFFTIQKYTAIVTESRVGVKECRSLSKVGRTESRECDPLCRSVVAACEWVPRHDVLAQIFAVQDRQVFFANDPTRDECTVGTVCTHDPARRDLVVHQNGKGAVAIVECTETIRYANHAIWRDTSGFRLTESPTVRIDFVTTPGTERTT